MNAITYTEARAVNTAAAVPLEAADPTKNLILVPLSRLVLRPRAATCARPRACPSRIGREHPARGPAANLIVIASADGEHYEVVAGGRRLAALKLLAKKHRISKNGRCLACWWPMAPPARPASPRTCSAKRCTRQFEAFAALVAEGRPIEDIARISACPRWWCSAA